MFGDKERYHTGVRRRPGTTHMCVLVTPQGDTGGAKKNCGHHGWE